MFIWLVMWQDKGKKGKSAEKAAKRKRPEDAEEPSPAVTALADQSTEEDLKPDVEEDEEDEDGEQEDGKDAKSKKSKKDAELCPAAGPGSCVIHDITPTGQVGMPFALFARLSLLRFLVNDLVLLLHMADGRAQSMPPPCRSAAGHGCGRCQGATTRTNTSERIQIRPRSLPACGC